MADPRLDGPQTEIVDRLLEQALLCEPATARDLVAKARSAVGKIAGDPCYRHVDRWLQRNRKNGLISFKRVGRNTLWSPTSAGREMWSGGDA